MSEHAPYFPALRTSWDAALAALAGRAIAVVGHARPDGDCIGSQVAMARMLRTRGHDVCCINADPVPRRLQYLVADLPFFTAEQLPADRDWAVVYVDCADHARAGEKARARFATPLVNIDHHLSNNRYAEHNVLDAQAAAACEILAGLFFDAQLPVDPITAKALFVGIMTDTGQFRFNSTTQRTFALAAALVALGADPAEAGGQIYERESAGKLQLLQRFLASLSLECDGAVCVGLLPNGVYEETGTSAEDTEGLVDYARSIDGVKIGVLIEVRAGAIKASLRSKSPAFRVDQIAARFGGGGHACAAGLNLKAVGLEEFRSQLLAAIRSQLTLVSQS